MTTQKISSLTKEQFLKLSDTQEIEQVMFESLNTSVFIRAISASERDAFEASCMAGKGKNRGVNMENVRARLLVKSICDETGKRLFADHEADALGNMPAKIADKLFSVAQKLSGLSPADVEEIAGN
jgi:hypothetical protein